MKKAIIFLGVGLIASTNAAFLKDPTTAVANSSATTTATAEAFKGGVATANASGSADAVATGINGGKAIATAVDNTQATAIATKGAVATSNAVGSADAVATAKDSSVAIANAKDVSSSTAITTTKDNAFACSDSAADASAIAIDKSFVSANADNNNDANAYVNSGYVKTNTSYDNCDDVRASTCDETPFNTGSVSGVITGNACNDDNTVSTPIYTTPIYNGPIVATPIGNNNDDCGCAVESTPAVVTDINSGVDIQKRGRVDQNTQLNTENSADAHTAAVQAATKEAFSNKAISLTNFDASAASNNQYAGNDSSEVNISKKHADSKVYADKNNNLCQAKRIFAEKCDRHSKEKLDDVHDCYDHSKKNKVCSSECSKDLETSNTDSCGCKTAKLSTWKQKKQETIHCDADKGRDDEVHAFKDCQNDYKQYHNVEVKKIHDDDLVKQSNCRQNDYYTNDKQTTVKQSNAQSGNVDITQLNSLSNQGSLASSFGASDISGNSQNLLGYNNQKSAATENLYKAFDNQSTGNSC